jgi:hypothetical protein
LTEAKSKIAKKTTINMDALLNDIEDGTKTMVSLTKKFIDVTGELPLLGSILTGISTLSGIFTKDEDPIQA